MAYERLATIQDAGGSLADFGRLVMRQRLLHEAVTPYVDGSLLVEDAADGIEVNDFWVEARAADAVTAEEADIAMNALSGRIG